MAPQPRGLGDDKYRLHDHEILAHYANAATDIEFEDAVRFQKEVEGIHSAPTSTSPSMKKFSGKKIQYFDPELNESYVPCPRRQRPPIGVDRMFLSVSLQLLRDAGILAGRFPRCACIFPAPLAPVKCAVLPLVKKDGLPEKAREIQHRLRFDFTCHYDEKDSIGKRYRRQDAVGTPTV